MIITLFLRCVLFILLPTFGISQITHRDLLQKNCSPSCLAQALVAQAAFGPFPQTAEAWRKVLPDTILKQLVRNGENALTENFPNIPATITLDFIRNANRTRYEGISFGKRNRLWSLVLAESIEGKKRFTDAIVDGIWSICEESFWGVSAHLFMQKSGSGLPDVEHPVVDLFAAETAANLALAGYFVGRELDSISPLIRRRIYYEVNRRIFIPLQSAKYDWMGKGDTNAKLNNWAPWIMSNYLTAALLLEKDSSKRIQYVSKAIQLTDQYINGIGEDGACEEGPHYWSFGPACVLDVLDLVASATNGRIYIYKQEIIRNLGAYIYRTHISGNYFVDVGDSHPEENPEPVMVWRFGDAVADNKLRSFGAWLFNHQDVGSIITQSFHRSRELFDLVNLKAIKQDKEVYQDDTDSWLPNVQLMTKRLSNGMFVAAHGGNNGESHNHNDVGDFVIYADGDPVIIDVGSGTYTAKTFSKDRYKLWFNASAFHNLPTINDQQQREGALHAAHDVHYSREKLHTILAMDIADAYAAELGIISWKRTIAADDQRITITDSFASKKPLTALTQTFMTVCNANLDQPGVILFTTEHGNKVSLHYDSNWQATQEPMPLVTEEEQGLKSTWHNKVITKIFLTYRSSKSSDRFEYIVSKE
jgi:heparinase II/III-like protein